MPKYQLANLISNIPSNQISFTIHYFPALACDGVETCTETEKQFGFVEFNKKDLYSGQISQDFEFKNFPFDKQRVNFSVISNDEVFTDEEYTHHTNLVFPEYGYKGFESSVDALYDPAWTISSTYFNYGTKLNNDIGLNLSTLNFGFLIERKTIFYWFKIFIPVSFILLISMSSLWINPKELESRLTISVVCLLSLIAYNYIIDQDIPKLGYLTLLDKLIFLAYFYAGIPTLQTVLIHYKVEKDGLVKSRMLENNIRILMPASFVILCAL